MGRHDRERQCRPHPHNNNRACTARLASRGGPILRQAAGGRPRVATAEMSGGLPIPLRDPDQGVCVAPARHAVAAPSGLSDGSSRLAGRPQAAHTPA